jgi:RNA recognition motif-containing protein
MKILIRNLARSVSQNELEELFKPFGAIASCTVVLDKETGKSKGFAFVEMPDPRQAIKAIKGLNTLRVHGYGIKVKMAEEVVKPSK